MPRKRAIKSLPALFAATALATLVSIYAAFPAYAVTYKVLHEFCSKNKCKDGQLPIGGLVQDGSGDLYGVTEAGGAFGSGTVFELAHGSGGHWTYSVLYSFCVSLNCTDGEQPQAGLIMDAAGNLYGTTAFGGDEQGGVVFKLSPNAGRTVWTETVLHSFCYSCNEGKAPVASLAYVGQSSGALYDGLSPLYGTDYAGGGLIDGGTVFQLSAGKSGKPWHLKPLYDFCVNGGDCLDGTKPAAPVLVSSTGNLFGTTIFGGSANAGVAFEISHEPGEKAKHETVIHSFCAADGCADGAVPSGLIVDGSGNFYGTAEYGGVAQLGTVFRMAPDGSITTLYDFCSQLNCADGAEPQGGVVMDASGNLYGTAWHGGASTYGTIFELGKSYQVLYSFCSKSDCKDGSQPVSPLILDKTGNLFGTATGGIASDGKDGVVFELTP
jgi:uncharacterized repeat protein (TIGR03803 family)